jgi:hypothetical protein
VVLSVPYVFGAAMFLRFEHRHRRLFITLAANRRVGRKVRQDRIGPLGSILWSEPISVSERIRFWTQLDARFRAIAARRPGVVSPDDADKARAVIDKKIPRARTEEELRLQLIAVIQRDVMAAFDWLERGEDAAAEAMKQLERLTREACPKAEAERLK